MAQIIVIYMIDSAPLANLAPVPPTPKLPAPWWCYYSFLSLCSPARPSASEAPRWLPAVKWLGTWKKFALAAPMPKQRDAKGTGFTTVR